MIKKIIIIALAMSQFGCLAKFPFLKKNEKKEEGIESTASLGGIKGNISSTKGQVISGTQVSKIADQKFRVIQRRIFVLSGENQALVEGIKLYELMNDPKNLALEKEKIKRNEEELKYYGLLAKYYKLNGEYESLSLRIKKAELRVKKVELQKYLFGELNHAFSLSLDGTIDDNPTNTKKDDTILAVNDNKNPDIKLGDGEQITQNKTANTGWPNAVKNQNCQEMSAILGKNVCDVLSQEDRMTQYYNKQMKNLNDQKKKLGTIYENREKIKVEIIKIGRDLIF